MPFYSPYSFIREIKPRDQYQVFIKERIQKHGVDDHYHTFSIIVDGVEFAFLYEFLPWDSNFMGRDCYRLFTVLFSHHNANALVKAAKSFKDKLLATSNTYCFSEIPSEDIFLLQCLNIAGFKMVETRFHYFRRKAEDFEAERYKVRKATTADIPILKEVAAKSRNEYDRLHADYSFSEEIADHYLATYAAAAVNGFCDYVLVPDVPGYPIASFLAFDSYEKISPKHNLSLMYARLAAVAPENTGWYVKLLTEFMHYAKEQKASYVKITTQSTNRTVIRTFDKLGCSFGACFHLLSLSS